MSTNRYGQIWHGDHHHINIRFPSTEARLKFQEEFETYHASHEHDGDIPIFKEITTKDLKLGTGSRTPTDLVKAETDDTYRITIDGYHWSEIRSYQDDQDLSAYNFYRPPTCCVPPTIVIDSEYVSSGELKRHPLSAIFGNMPDNDFQSLLSSVASDGFIEPVIRIYEGQILDGWHRYRAAQELGIIRKLRFREWNEDSHRDGDPKVFVLARNIERRHLNAAQRAQIAVTFNERFGMGRPTDLQKVHQNGELKTRSELATEANVGTSTIDRAVQVEKAGRAEEVISGEKSASAIIDEITIQELWKQINPAISEWKKAREGVGHASKTMFIQATLRWEGLPSDTETDVKVLKELLNLLTTKETNILEELVRKKLDGKDLWNDTSTETETTEPAESEQQETKQPEQTAEERETNKELKRKKQVAKALWDKRIQAGRDYLGDGDSDLNLYLTLPELEKGFIESSPTYEYEFKIALKLTSKPDFPLMWEKAAQDSLKDLEKYQRVMALYVGDILQWERPDWSPDTNWILPLIEAKKAKVTEKDVGTESSEEGSSEQNAFNLAFNNARTRLSWMWDTFDNIDYLTGVSREDFAIAAAKALNCYEEDQYSSGENYLLEKDYALLKNLTTSELKKWTKRFDKIQDAIHHNADWVKEMQPDEATEPEPDMHALWDAFNKRLPKWKAKYAESGYKENELVQAATEAELFDALRSYRHSDRTGPVTAEEIKDVTDLMKRQSYPYTRHLRNLLRDKHKRVLSDTDRCYVENQLRVVENAISPLLERLGADDIAHHDKERLTADLYDVFLQYENVPTEREMIIALLDVVDGILSEDVPETLDNEVLCPDDEADRQAMNGDLVTSAE